MSLLLTTAQRAFDTVPLYRSLYGSRPQHEADVPFLSASAFHRMRGPLDAVAFPERIRGVVPAFSPRARRLPISVIESEEEWRLRLERLRHALAIVGAAPAAGLRFVIVTDEASGPFASDIANFLAWDRVECSILLAWRSAADIAATLAALSPDIVLIAGATDTIPHLRAIAAKLLACVHVNDPQDRLVDMDRLLVSDEMFIMGAANIGEPNYQFDQRSLLIEADPATGRGAVTTTAFNCFALVRYRLDLPAIGHDANAAF